MMEKYFNVLMILVFVVLVISIFFSLFRTIIGPRRADRIMGINMIGGYLSCVLSDFVSGGCGSYQDFDCRKG